MTKQSGRIQSASITGVIQWQPGGKTAQPTMTGADGLRRSSKKKPAGACERNGMGELTGVAPSNMSVGAKEMFDPLSIAGATASMAGFGATLAQW